MNLFCADRIIVRWLTRGWLWLGILGLGLASSSAQGASGNAAHLQFKETVYDFGQVVFGEVVKHDFVFTNTSDVPLVIKEVHATCGCTSATNLISPVEPGKTGTIHSETRTIDYNGPISKTIRVTSNDEKQPVMMLEVKGTVWRPIEVTPPTASFLGTLNDPSNAVRVLHIIRKQPEPLMVWNPKASREDIGAELKTNKLGDDYELSIRLIRPTGLGNIFGNVKLSTTATNVPVLSVAVWAVPTMKR
jgi:hypothetical protein